MIERNTIHMQYLDKENNPVTPERFAWVVFYAQGEKLVQFDTDGYHYFAEIDQERAEVFGMVSNTGKQVLKTIPKGAKLIHYYDNIIQQPLGGAAVHHRLYCFGYELGKDKKIWTILPTDVVVEGKIDDIEIM